MKIKLGNYKSAIEYIDKSLAISKKLGLLDNQLYAYQNLSDLYEKLNDLKKSLDYNKLYISINDSIFNSKKHRQIAQMEALYQTEKKEQQIALQKSELSKKEEEGKRKDLQRNALLGGVLLLSLFLVFVVRSFLQKKKSNRLLSAKNAEIMQQKEEIQAQADQLELTNLELEKLSIAASKTDNSVVIADAGGNIEWVNAGFAKLFGYSLDEFKRDTGANIIETSGNPDIKEIINLCIDTGQTVSYIVLNSTKSGQKIWVQTTLTPIVGNSGKVLKLIAIDSDITKLKNAEEEITQQKEELKTQSEQLANANKILNKKNIQITDSIRYAKKIQEAILPSFDTLKKFFPDSFIFFQPRDIVSGDFYWLSDQGDRVLLALADCTGHGVPGAFMSMIGNSLLNEIVNVKKVTGPALILKELDKGVKYALSQHGESDTIQDDGMDITFCSYDKLSNRLVVSGVNQSVIFFSNSQITVLEGCEYSIGNNAGNDQKMTFTEHDLTIGTGAQLYMFSDGFTDQFGGPENKKFGITRLKKILEEIHTLPPDEQQGLIGAELEKWKGHHPQTDDITILGIRLT